MALRMVAVLGGVLLLSMVGRVAPAGDWLRFRGPNGSGISTDTEAGPVKWSATENLKWKAALPGAGVSCPIVVGDRVFVTCYSGYGLDRRNPGDQKDLKRHLVCLDKTSGKILWDKSVAAVLPEDPYSGAGVPEHGYASHTPISDGKRVYVFFGKSGALAFDLDGNQLWQTGLGTESDPRRWGSSSSPILYKNRLIVTASAESQALVALDVETGKEVWRQEAQGFANLWGTPILVPVDAEQSDLVVGVPYEIWGFNPETGKLRWYCEAMETDQFNSSVVAGDGVVYAIEGRGGGSIAVRVGGNDDVTKSHVVWTGNDSGRFGTPLLHDGRIYVVSNKVATCIDAKTGQRIYQERLTGGSTGRGGQGAPDGQRAPGGQPGRGFGGRGGGGFGGGDYSSLVAADGKLYFVARNGDAYVYTLGEKFEQLGVNRVTDDSEDFSATPAISQGDLFIRSDKHLYCVGLPR